MRFWIGVLIVSSLMVVLGSLLFLSKERVRDDCEAKGGVAVETRSEWVCLDSDVVLR